MNPYEPPSTSTSVPSVSLVAIVILSAGTIGLVSIAAVLCGLCCYHEIAGNMDDDLVPVLLMFGVPVLLFSGIGIPAGMIHLRSKSKLERIPAAVYIVAITALVGASLLANPLTRWLSIFLVWCLASIVAGIRTAVRYERAIDESPGNVPES